MDYKYVYICQIHQPAFNHHSHSKQYGIFCSNTTDSKLIDKVLYIQSEKKDHAQNIVNMKTWKFFDVHAAWWLC